MNVIVVVGSKHGSTRSIAEAVDDELRNGGLRVTIVGVESAAILLDGYDAAVIGSAVYVGRWMKDARPFIEANRETLRKIGRHGHCRRRLRGSPDHRCDHQQIR